MSISTALTAVPVVKSDHIEVPLDGVAFRTSSGYSRTGTPGTLPGVSQSLSEGVQLEVSSFMLNSAFNVAKEIGIPVDVNFYGYSLRGQLDQSQTSSVEFESGLVKFIGGADLTVFKVDSITKVGAIKGDFNIFFEAGSVAPAAESTDAMDVKLKLRNLSVNSLALEWGSINLDLTWLRWPINGALWLLTWFISYDNITEMMNVPQVSFSAVTLLKGDVAIRSKYASIGADVDFTGSL